MKTIKISFILLILLFCSLGCQRLDDRFLSSDRLTASMGSTSDANLAEVATPRTIARLERTLEEYVPQVKIVAPRSGQTFNQTEINVELAVENLPIFRDEELQLGNHLNLIIDNEPAQRIYSLSEPVTLKNLTPGTHSLRVFAVRPWGESFKNEEAYAQIVFNVLTETNDNRPDAERPLLTYSSPTGVYGAEPILLDFYLTNAPLHAIAQNNSQLEDWRVRATVNGTSFTLENWQPVYLTGLKPGENWVQLELVNEAGRNIENAFNNTVRVFQYDPQRSDTLAKLVTDNISLVEAKAIVEPDSGSSETLAEKTEAIDDDAEPGLPADSSLDTSVESEPSLEIPSSDKEPTVSGTSKVELEEKESSALEEPTEKTAEPTTTILKTETENEKLQDSSDITAEPPEKIAEPEAAILETKTENDELQDSSKITTTNSDRLELQQPEAKTEQTITIVEADSEEAETVATIDLSPSESLEITESETENITPPIQPDNSLETTESTQRWKKFLVGLRRQIEALAKQLPNEA